MAQDDLLSQDEIDALLSGVNGDSGATADASSTPGGLVGAVQRFARRDVVYLLGQNDTCACSKSETDCACVSHEIKTSCADCAGPFNSAEEVTWS